MIRHFRDRDTERIFEGRRPKKLPQEISDRAETKLAALDAAESVDDMRFPPGNRLEQLRGERVGQWSVRINRQFRLCFRFDNGDAYEVEITDYH